MNRLMSVFETVFVPLHCWLMIFVRATRNAMQSVEQEPPSSKSKDEHAKSGVS